jgi:hypothetical protein
MAGWRRIVDTSLKVRATSVLAGRRRSERQAGPRSSSLASAGRPPVRGDSAG